MIDEHTLAVMEADTLAETFRLDLRMAGDVSTTLVTLEWCPASSMLAVHLQSSGPDEQASMLHGTSEVQIFDAASGLCLFSLALQAWHAHITWSSSLRKLAVRCPMEGDIESTMSEALPHRPATIRVLDPALRISGSCAPGNCFGDRFGCGLGGLLLEPLWGPAYSNSVSLRYRIPR